MLTTILPGFLGLTLGMRHALEPDHLAAISALATEQRRSALWLGFIWGIGHSTTLLIVGGALVLAGAHMPAALTACFEVLIATVIITLGVRSIRRSLVEGQTGSPLTHRHGALEHRHTAPREHVHLRRWTLSTRPLLVGILHGLAGSGALVAAVVAELADDGARVAYLLVFGLGTTLGMALLTGLASLPLKHLARNPVFATRFFQFSGAVSILMGLWWGSRSIHHLLME